ncbi:unnamed protein product (macronuclear) [Paramecium tetraurelia]|uniref:Uncharacterized protein n=1 Tax=Paramecium tetraurelia TaxID=5888 RepID=A0BJG8_PARTE|nr:uncharacterized protein GSPATT00029312001 [Paramecium tetraurelia]CAK58685.1 unnamed protein product [Paramecium tetraurelia]|eukprot:XP_001426083.1 hypothetical protein (macronuclear) [Paramecium tetraurelia strain d4-2]
MFDRQKSKQLKLVRPFSLPSQIQKLKRIMTAYSTHLRMIKLEYYGSLVLKYYSNIQMELEEVHLLQMMQNACYPNLAAIK